MQALRGELAAAEGFVGRKRRVLSLNEGVHCLLSNGLQGFL